MLAKDFFLKGIKEKEVDTMIIPDATEVLLVADQGDRSGFDTVTKEITILEGLDITKKLAAWLILLAKYTNSKESILLYSDTSSSYPIYTELSDNESCADIEANVKAWMKKVDDLEDIQSLDMAAIIKDLELQPMVSVSFSKDEQGRSEEKIKIYMENTRITVRYHKESYMVTTIDRLIRSYENVLTAVIHAEKLSDIKLTDTAMEKELDGFLDNAIPYDKSKTVVDLFAEAASKYPDNTAVVYKEKKLTYKELDEITDRIAQYVHSRGIGEEKVVSILINRSEFMPIASIGVLKAGAAYQPLDPSYPVERLNFMIKDADAKLLIAEEELLDRVSEYNGDILLTKDMKDLPKADKKYNLSKVNGLFILLYTSGSTGVPKGVMLEQRNLVAFINWYIKYYKVDETSHIAAYASYGFDADMMDMYPIITAGGELHIIEEAIRLELLKLNEYYENNQITHSFITTQVGRQYAQMFPDAKYPKYLSIGGETLVPMEPPTGYDFFNAYGPTECTIFSTIFKVDRLYSNVPIGKALTNTHLYVLDKNLKRLPVGVPGELGIAGPQLARGYLNRPEQTEISFVKNPYDEDPDYNRIYRTGDVVRFLSDGNIEFIGRKDSQVKIRGFRIELSEVEGIIREFAGIKDATVLAFDEAGGGKYIVAYIVSDDKIDISKLNDFIRENKPPYMVPAVTMQIDQIPLNQNHKVDKKSLPKPERQDIEMIKPKNEGQERIYGILKDILQHEEFGITTTFAEAGLTSIASIRFIVELTRALDVPVSIQDLNENPTVEVLEKYLSSLDHQTTHETREKYPLTQTQLGIYVECLRNPESVQYNLPGAFALDKDTDIEALQKAIGKVMDAHKSMKCVIHEDAQGDIFMVPRPEENFEIELVEGSEAQWPEYFAHYALPFDLKKQLLFRFTLYKTECHVYLLLDFHHIVSDGSSIAVFVEEIDRVLRGEKVAGEIFSQYDIAVLEEKKRASEAYTKAKTYYDSVFLENSASFSLAGDRNILEESCGFKKIFDEKVSKAEVASFCKKHKITENVFFTYTFGYVMGQYNHSEDAVYTTIYNGRNDSRLMNTFGMLVKTLPVYSYFPKDMTIAEYFTKGQAQLLDSMRHDIFSFAEISHAYKIKPEIMFVYQGDDFVEFEIGGQKTIFHEAESDKAKANISINIFVENGKYRYEFEYKSNLYSEKYIERLYDIYVQTVSSILRAEKISDINILSDEQAKVIDGFNDTDYPVEIMSVNRLFEAWVEKKPDEIAVIACKEKLTYAQLNRYANKVANGLIKRGSKMDTLVGLILDREKNVYITRQGILKAGAGFLPLVTEYPDDRIDFCLKDAACQFVITTEKIKEDRKDLFRNKPYEVLTVEELLADTTVTDANPNLVISPDNICYCLYTSGSTGNPKGVLIEHKTLCNFVHSNRHNIEIENYTKNGKVSLAFAAITFDVSVMEEFIPLCNGMTICMANEEEIHNPMALSDLLLENKVDIMKCTPSFMMSIVDIPQMAEALDSIKAFDIGAEAFPPVLYEKMRAVNKHADIINSYGPTECTISCTSKLIDETGEVNIGGPLSNMKLYVVNSSNMSLPVGISGELIICGSGVGRGYMNLPDKTKEAFFTYKGLPAYHSGDLVKWNEAGEIVFLGRIDNQVKLRGLRVELDEVENAISAFEGIKSCKVVVKKNAADEFLAAYFTAVREIDKDELHDFISQRLAHYMVPGAMMQLDEMPLTNHGKIDKKRLPEIDYVSENREYVAPETELEKELCDEFAKVLALDKVSVCDSFFEIGGTSLSATKVVLYCNAKNYNVVYKDIFENPSPRKLAQLILGEKPVTEKEDKSNIKGFDYQAINRLIKRNHYESTMTIHKKQIGNVLLTGATGFLGIHILRELIRNKFGKIYCLVRKGASESCEQRLNSLYMYYFGRIIKEEEWEIVSCIDADITDDHLANLFADMEFSTIINCAACVKHFVKDDLLDRINVLGVKNLIELALVKKAEFIHVSTSSVAGEGNEETVPFSKLMKEDELYFGQIIENDYIRTKFIAEREILTAVTEFGLNAKIMRVGNLMSRHEDGEFQINFVTNGFMRALKAYKTIGKFPLGAMHSFAEFSPIDSTAQAIITLMQCEEKYTVFHAFNSHKIFMSDVIYSMKDYGFEIDIVTDEEFEFILSDIEKSGQKSDTLLGLIAYKSSDKTIRYEIGADNRFTTEVLYRMGYKWPITDDAYLRNAIEALDGLDFFE